LAKRRKQRSDTKGKKQAFHGATLAGHPAARNLNKAKNRHLVMAILGIA
jgi:hypothetical protein